jgi:hypothetical protein
LTDLTAKATSKSQFSAAIKAVVEKSRIAGLLIERVEIGAPYSFEQCSNAEAIIDEMLKYKLNPYHAVTEQDRETLIEMLNRQVAELHTFIEEIKSRPYITVSPPKQIGFGNGKARSINGQ